jgi:hypothetical protein
MLAATRHTDRRTNETTSENEYKGKGSESERERACDTHLAATRHTDRRTNEWPAAAQWCAWRDRDEAETSLSQREGKKGKERTQRKSGVNRKRELTGRTVTSSPSLDRTRSSESLEKCVLCEKMCRKCAGSEREAKRKSV